MIENLIIENFKGINNLEIKGLKLINVLVGDNGIGKTNILDAIEFLYTNHIFMKYDEQSPQAIEHLFYQNDINNKITITSDNNYCSLYYQKLYTYRLPMQEVDVYRNAFVLERKNNDTSLLIKRNGQKLQCVYNSDFSDMDNVVHFNKFKNILNIMHNILNINSLNERIILIMKHFMPDLIKIFISTNDDGKAELKFMQKINDNILNLRLQDLSDGIQKSFILICIMLTYKNHIILIDEIENSIYYSYRKELLNIIIDLAIENNNQLFITTHSYELLQKLSHIEKLNDDSFLCTRISKIKNKNLASYYDWELFLYCAGHSEIR